MNRLRKLFIEAVMSELNLKEDDIEMSSSFKNAIDEIASTLGCETLLFEMREGVLSKSAKVLMILALLAIAEKSPYKVTQLVKDVSDIVVKYIVTPVDDVFIEPIVDKVMNVKNKVEDTTKNVVDSIKDLPNKAVEVTATLSKDVENKVLDLTSLSASVSGEKYSFDVSSLSNNLKDRILKDSEDFKK